MIYIINYFDFPIRNWFLSIRTYELTILMKIITNLGSSVSIILISLLFISSLCYKKRHHEAIRFGLGISCGFFISELLKAIIQRPRPPFPWLIDESGFSFPSGHSLVTMTFFLFLLVTGRHTFPKFLNQSIINGLLLIIPVLVGISRVYLGVHYPSDVFGGWMIGIVWTVTFLNLWNKIMKKPLSGRSAA